ncbi:hypothetical protein [Embleya sp. NPDC005575]|uniref:hypothetical protein n=1 Tax=Embleya sp. NPDC005575 TaxID=3156892 RepID=UPI00339F3725
MRAAQIHALMLTAVGKMTRLPVVPTVVPIPGGVRLQPRRRIPRPARDVGAVP